MSDLKRLVEMAEKLSAQKAEWERAEAAAKAAKAAYTRTERETLPGLMEEIGVPSLTLPSGEVVEIVEDCAAHISATNAPAAHRWLVDNNFGGILKSQVLVEFGRGDIDRARELAERLGEEHPETQSKQTVHASTLKSFVREQLAAGTPIPFDLFGIHPFSRAVLKKK